ncbi:hypothetical protein HKI87_06g42740 [Chloropicon roscoffensis]|uniref:Uncharacterized protein n=1 Tax=Chloropicon roscoffensis TaxID=1461544 RepID=A0AAX4P9N9_9CHLO
MVGVVRSPGGHRILTKSAVTPRVSSRASPRRCEVSFRKRRDLVVAFDGQNELETTSPAETSAGNGQPYCGCGKCDGQGRIIGGMGSIPGFGWWPIKAYRPCPAYTEAGKTYQRKGQILDKILFGRDGEESEF